MPSTKKTKATGEVAKTFRLPIELTDWLEMLAQEEMEKRKGVKISSADVLREKLYALKGDAAKRPSSA